MAEYKQRILAEADNTTELFQAYQAVLVSNQQSAFAQSG